VVTRSLGGSCFAYADGGSVNCCNQALTLIEKSLAETPALLSQPDTPLPSEGTPWENPSVHLRGAGHAWSI
jgi:hypothetical protein